MNSLCWNRHVALLVSGLALASYASGFATRTTTTGSCGKARVMSRAFKAGYSPTMVPMRGKALESLAHTDVLRYSLDIEAIPTTNTISGSNTILIKSQVDNLNQFHFRLSNSFTVSSVTLDGRPITFTREDSINCRANFDVTYNNGQQFTLKITYSGVASGGGFGSVTWGTHSGTAYFETLSEPYYCYTWWPAKEDNTDKALADIWVTVPNALKVISNGLLTATEPVGATKTKYKWTTNYPISPYLISVAATNYAVTNDVYNYTGGSMPISLYFWPEDNSAGNIAAWLKCKDMLATYKNIFGLYPFINEKYSIYQFTLGGGMAHQTCTGQGTTSESVTAHELGHQWWGDMVTCAGWEDIWVNEGFATYTEALWLEKKPGSTGLPALQSAMSTRRPTAVNDSVYCYDTSSVNRIFSTNFSYRKGAWVLHQLRHVMGDTGFFAGLAEYRLRHAGSTATTDQLRLAMEAVYGGDLSWFFTPMVMQPGAPAYNWGWQTTAVNGKNYLMVSISQTQSTSYPTYTMPIDIRPTVGGVKQNLKVWDTSRTQNFVLPLTGPATACTFDEDVWVFSTNNTNGAYVARGPKIVESSPGINQTVLALPRSISVVFHTPVSINASQVHFRPAGSSRNIPIRSFTYDSLNNKITFVPDRRLINGRFEIVIDSTVTATNSGQQLDGEIGANLPSGDGIAGGQAVIPFTVQ